MMKKRIMVIVTMVSIAWITPIYAQSLQTFAVFNCMDQISRISSSGDAISACRGIRNQEQTDEVVFCANKIADYFKAKGWKLEGKALTACEGVSPKP